MNQQELTQYNVGQNLDDLMNLDPRGYGVCRILYPASRKLAGEPVTLHAAKKLTETIKEGSLVYILTGFVLIPSHCAETDGIISAMLLARALVKAFGAKPVLVCAEENLPAVRSMASVVGLHLYETIEEMKKYPISMAVVPFMKDAEKAPAQADQILSHGIPSIIISTECAGANQKGVYHNAIGQATTEFEAKTDILFEKAQKKGVPTISIGDLGNELGLGTLGEHLNRYIPYAAPGACSCGCGGGLAVKTKADIVLTATVSNWGCYGLTAALAFLKKDIGILQDTELEKEAILAASHSGMVNMDGWLEPAVDGFDVEMNVLIVGLMRKCVDYALHYEHYNPGKTWFSKVLELEFFKQSTSTVKE
ncbi:MAG TPA: DUF4392 domain-containing protein [Caproicibacter sp.]|nr:DUF4392 domain-containing protein [Caproicibacter sp.]